MDARTARTAYVVPAMQQLNLYTLSAEYLLMGTAAIESNFVNFLQFGGPALGMFQIEQETFSDIVVRYLALPKNTLLRQAAFQTSQNSSPTFYELTNNHLLSATLARIKYAMVPAGIPFTLEGQAYYWWIHYNGRSPRGLKPADYISRWHTFCAPLYPDFT